MCFYRYMLLSFLACYVSYSVRAEEQQQQQEVKPVQPQNQANPGIVPATKQTPQHKHHKAKVVPEAPKPPEGEELSPLSMVLKNRLKLSNSYGFVRIRKGANDWHAAGMSDIGIAYQPEQQAFWLSFRYAPMDVAPQRKRAYTEAYKGVVEAYHLGLLLEVPSDSFQLLTSAELGLERVHLKEEFGASADPLGAETGFSFTVGGELRWFFGEKMSLGPKLHIGVGTFSVLQFAGNVSFLF